jgi:hypothetical protein
MKSLEHLIREIREGKTEKTEKKSLGGSIRKVMSRESSFAAKDSKPVDEDVAGMAGSGEGKTYGESGKKKKQADEEDTKLPGNEDKMDEAVGTIGTDKFQGRQFQSVTPHIAPPNGETRTGVNTAKKVELKRNDAKDKTSLTMQGKVTEQAVVNPLTVGAAFGVGGAAYAALKSGKGLEAAFKAGKKGADDLSSKIDKALNPSEEDLKAAQEKLKAADAAKTAPKMDVAPDVTSKQKEVPPVVLPTSTAAPAPAKVGTDTTAAPIPAQAGAVAKPGTVAEPIAKPGTITKPITGAETVTTPISKATATTKTATKAETTTTPKPRFPGFGLPSFGGGSVADGAGGDHYPRAGTKFHRAKLKESSGTEVRKNIEDMPRSKNSDRKNIGYIGRPADDTKTNAEKLSRQAQYKIKVIDEAKKLAGIVKNTFKEKKEFLDKPTKSFNNGKGDLIVVNPDLNKINLDTKDQT